MTAAAISPVTTSTGPGVGAGQPGAGGALGVFDALLAALGSDPALAAAPPGDAPPSPAPAAPVLAAADPDAGGAAIRAPTTDGETDLSLDPADPAATDAAVLALATAPLTIPIPPTAPTAEPSTPAWGRQKSAGLPAAPALANAAERSAILEAGEVEVPPAPEGGASTPSGAAPARPATSERPTAAPSAAVPSAPPPATAEPTADATPDAPPAPLAAAAAAKAQAPLATAAATATLRADVASRPAKADRARAAAESAEPAAATEPRKPADGPVGARAARAAEAVSAPGADAPRAEIAPPAPDGEDLAPAPIEAAADATSATITNPTAPVRGAPETVANLAAQILKKLDGQSTRFDVELDPAGLGKVDVRIEVGALGRVTAAMTFDNPQAAQDLKARAGELRQALEQAGFDLSGGLSFDVAQDGGRQGQAWQDAQDRAPTFRGEAFRAALAGARDADVAALAQGPLNLRRGVTAGLDLRI